MNRMRIVFASTLVFGLLTATSIHARAEDGKCERGGEHSGRGGGVSGEMHGQRGFLGDRSRWRQQWMQEHKKILQSLREMDRTLDQKLRAMNQAEGKDKINAMAATINELVKQRENIDKHIEQMMQRNMARLENRPGTGRFGMRHGGMGQGGMGRSEGSGHDQGSGHSDQWKAPERD